MKFNEQAPMPVERKDTGEALYVHSIFKTIQGEGPFAGTPAVFVRLGGCNLQCPLCDTEYSNASYVGVQDILTQVLALATKKKLVVITGGEPFRQPIAYLVRLLLACDLIVQLETNGSLYRDLPFNHPRLAVVCSPKTGTVHPKLEPHIDALKYVARDADICSDDGLPVRALAHPTHGRLYRKPAGHRASVYLQPVDEQDEAQNAANLRAVVESCQEHGHYLCLQLHKYVNLP